MNVAKWLLLVPLALPFLELAAFVAVAKIVGFGWALLTVLAVILQHARKSRIARVRVALREGHVRCPRQRTATVRSCLRDSAVDSGLYYPIS